MNEHVQECPRFKYNGMEPEIWDEDSDVSAPWEVVCICKELLSAGARGFKDGYDQAKYDIRLALPDAYDEGYQDGYDSALSHRTITSSQHIGLDNPFINDATVPFFNQHGQGENP